MRPSWWNFTWRASPHVYLQHCAQLLTQLGARCFPVRPGWVLAWSNRWRLDGSLEGVGAHVACPVLKGSKWVASAWLNKRCPTGRVCRV